MPQSLAVPMSKKVGICITATLLIVSFVQFAHAFNPAPLLRFADLTSGPATGNSDTSLGQPLGVNGAIITLHGQFLGDTQEDSTITIGGQPATYVYVWEPARGRNKPGETYRGLSYSHRMQRISVQVPAGADSSGISVTVNDKTSNILPFTVRPGNIYYVDDSATGPGIGTYTDPWKSPASFATLLATDTVDGAICYFREGVYANTEYAGSNYKNLALFRLSGSHAGTEALPNAFIGYPGEVASLEATAGDDKVDPGYFIGIIVGYDYNSPQWINFSNFRMETNTTVLNPGVTGARFTGNLIIGATVFQGGSGLIVVKSHDKHKDDPGTYLVHDMSVLGNVVTGETTHNKLNHSFYGGSSVDCEIGFNYSYDMDFDTGPHISFNDENALVKGFSPPVNFRVHNNIIDMSAHPSRAIGTADLAAGADILFYNNIIIGPGARSTGGQADNTGMGNFKSGNIRLYHNTLVNAGGQYHAGVFDFIYNTKTGYEMSVDLRNNVFHATGGDSSRYLLVENATGISLTAMDNNRWYGVENGTFDGLSAMGPNSAIASVISDMDAGNYALTSSIPGEDLSLSLHTHDIFGKERIVWDIGAIEFETGSDPCNDGVQNGSETGIDCGGSCKECEVPVLLQAPGGLRIMR